MSEFAPKATRAVRYGTIAALLLTLTAGASYAQTQVSSGLPTGTPNTAPVVAGTGAGADYRIGAGDLLNISVYRAPDLGGLIRVGTDGTISFPAIGSISVGDKTAGDVSRAIAAQLKGKGILIDPNVNVLVSEVRAHVVEVLGQVGRPGPVPLDRPGMTLAGVLARAGATFGTGSGVVTVVSPNGPREQFLLADLLSGQRDRVAGTGEILVVQAAATFYVSGEVGHAGAFGIERNMTVGQALALGGGITPRGSRNRVTLTRKQPDGKTVVYQKVKDTMPVQPDDLIVVRQRVF